MSKGRQDFEPFTSWQRNGGDPQQKKDDAAVWDSGQRLEDGMMSWLLSRKFAAKLRVRQVKDTAKQARLLAYDAFVRKTEGEG
jgi:hypothetical protein